MPAEGEDKILRWNIACAFEAVLFIGVDVDDRARADNSGFAGDGRFERALLDEHHLLVFMMVSGMRHLAGRHGRDVQVDGEAIVSSAVEDLAGFGARLGILLDGHAVEIVAAGGEDGIFGGSRGSSSKKRKQKA